MWLTSVLFQPSKTSWVSQFPIILFSRWLLGFEYCPEFWSFLYLVGYSSGFCHPRLSYIDINQLPPKDNFLKEMLSLTFHHMLNDFCIWTCMNVWLKEKTILLVRNTLHPSILLHVTSGNNSSINNTASSVTKMK